MLKKVLIVGGGIGGLTASIALKQQGIESARVVQSGQNVLIALDLVLAESGDRDRNQELHGADPCLPREPGGTCG